MKTPYVQAVGPSYRLNDVSAAVQSSINCYPQKLDGDTWNLVSIPGETEIYALGAEIRGQRNVLSRNFIVAGSTLYEGSTSRGSLATSSGDVSMSHNATQLVIVDGPNLYVFTLATNVLTQITSEGWRGSYNVSELDGYFVFVDPDTEQFYVSAIDDGSTLDALDFSSADSSPDNINTHLVSHRQLMLFGTVSTEIWINSGAAAFPFVRYNSYTLDVGCVGKHAAILAADTVFWIGETARGTGIVYSLSGNQPQRVSTVAVEEALKGSTDIAGSTMFTYQIEGHEFIGINAPGLSTTWVYDAALQLWHERGEWNDGWEPLRGRHVIALNGEHYAGDANGKVTRLDKDVYTLNGRVLVRERTWPHMVKPTLDPVSYRGVEIACATGAGGNITLQISNDGGVTFGPPLLRSLGVTGRWMQRVRWLGLGISFARVFRLRVSDAVGWTLYSASVDI